MAPERVIAPGDPHEARAPGRKILRSDGFRV
jgi:hypothetical protein